MTTQEEAPTPTLGKIAWFNGKTGHGVAAVLGEDGVVRRYFVTQTRILESPKNIEAGDLIKFCGSTPSKPGLLPVVLGAIITKKPLDLCMRVGCGKVSTRARRVVDAISGKKGSLFFCEEHFLANEAAESNDGGTQQ